MCVRKELSIGYCVYEHVFPDGSKYIGITMQNPYQRWGNRGNGYRYQPVYQIIQKYDWDDIQHNIIYSNLSLEEAQKYEKELIAKYQTRQTGWNRTNGGDAVSIFEINGKRMTSAEVAQMSNISNINGHDITTRINHHGWTLNKALNKKKVVRGTLYEYRGKQYTAKELVALSPVKGMNIVQMLTRLNRHHWTVERAVNQPFGKKKQPFGRGEREFEYKGKLYNSYELLQLSPIKDELSSYTITERIHHHGWDVERAITQPKRKRNNTHI